FSLDASTPPYIYTLSLHDALPIFGQIVTLLQASFGAVVKTGGQETFTLTKREHNFEALAALVPGVGDAMGILCMGRGGENGAFLDRKSTRLNSSHDQSSYAVFCLK